MIPEYPHFKELEIGDKTEIDEFLRRSPQSTCELSMSSLYAWKKFDRPTLTLINGNLCILMDPLNEPPYFLEPIGDRMFTDTARGCLEHAGVISRATTRFVSQLNGFCVRVRPLRNHFDYIYSREGLAALEGRKYDGKRQHVRAFERSYPGHLFVPFGTHLKEDALHLFETWDSVRRESSSEVRRLPQLAYTAQRDALKMALFNFEELGLLGGAILIDDALKGFIIGDRLSDRMATVQFMYGYPGIRAIYQVLLWRACKDTFSSFEYVNLEQDLGLQGLRKMKLSYQPLRMEEKYEVRGSSS